MYQKGVFGNIKLFRICLVTITVFAGSVRINVKINLDDCFTSTVS